MRLRPLHHMKNILKHICSVHPAVWAIAAVSSISFLLLLHGDWTWQRAMDRNLPLLDNLMRLRVNSAQAYLRLEEELAMPGAGTGGSAGAFAEAKNALRDAESGKTEIDGVQGRPIRDPVMIAQLRRVRTALNRVQSLARDRLRNPAESGLETIIGRRFDNAFRRLDFEIAVLGGLVRRDITATLASARRLHKLALLVWAVVVVLAAAALTMALKTQRQAQEALRRETAKLSTMIAGMDQGVMFANSDGVVVEANDSMHRFTGLTRDAIIGRRLSEVYPHDSAYGRILECITAFRTSARCEPCSVQQTLNGLEVTIRVQPICRDDRYDGVLVNIIDVTELVNARREAEAASRAKTDFLANISHEIRSPLTAVMGMTDLALATSLTTVQREYLETSKKSAGTLLKLVNQLLDFSMIEKGGLPMERVPFALRELLDEVLRAYAVRAEEKGLELVYQVRRDVPDALVGDPTRLRQVIANLVDNAVKYTATGEVVLRVRTHSLGPGNVSLHFSFTDTGIGMPAQQQKAIFEVFTRLPGPQKARIRGTGIGLPLSARLVSMMGGRIWVESELGKGSTFHFTATFGLPGGVPAKPVFELPPEVQGLRLLVVDDNASSREILCDALTGRGLEVVSVDSGPLALAAVEEAERAGTAFSIAVIDAGMPVMDGFALADTLSKIAPHVAIIILTGAGRLLELERCRERGFAACLAKPVSESELVSAVARIMGAEPVRAAREAVKEPAPPALPPPERLLNVLLAEDDDAIRMVAGRMIESRGHSVTLATNGREAVELLEKQQFDLVLMDVRMPEMDGLQATAAVRRREQERGGHVPIVALTAYATEGERERCLRAGMDGYISKPFDANELIDAVESYALAATA